jgi:hypothetical protein
MAERAPFPFVVGCGRSGTTLMRALLDAHPDLAVPFESYFPVWFARHRTRYERPEGFAVDRFVDDVVAHESFQRWGLDAARVRTSLRDAAPATYPDAVRAYYAVYAHAHGKSRYGDKTPLFVLHIPLLAELFPEAVFVHMVRDGRNVVLSRVETAWGTDRFDFEALQWRSQIERGRADGRVLGPDRYLEVRYEDLVTDPEGQARRVCALAAVDFDPAMLTYHEHAETILDHQPFPEEHRNLTRPPTAGLRDWTAELPAPRVELFEQLAGDTLTTFGYARATTGAPPRVRARASLARARYEATMQYRRARRVLAGAIRGRGDR